MSQSIDTLILAPHVDDEVLGCSGFLNSRTQVLWFGTDDFHEVSREERLAEARAVADRGGFGFTLLDNPVNRYNSHELIQSIEKLLVQLKPNMILLPRPSYNQDHRAVYEAGFTAVRPHDRLPFVNRVLVYDQVHASLWPRDSFQANYWPTHSLSKNEGRPPALLALPNLGLAGTRSIFLRPV